MEDVDDTKMTMQTNTDADLSTTATFDEWPFEPICELLSIQLFE
jgi:hypothetical protein